MRRAKSKVTIRINLKTILYYGGLQVEPAPSTPTIELGLRNVERDILTGLWKRIRIGRMRDGAMLVLLRRMHPCRRRTLLAAMVV